LEEKMASNNPTKKIKWGIWGTGKIAHDFASAMAVAEDCEIVFVSSRKTESAFNFAKKFGIPRFGLDVDLLRDAEVEVVYVSVIHPYHYDCSIKALQAGKAVLCEKPLAMNTKQIEEMIKVAKEKKLFFMEGIWTRFFPIIVKLRKILESNEIGPIQLVHGSFGFRDDTTPRLHEKELGGGSLLDIGIYPLSMISMLYNAQYPVKITSIGTLLPSGVDGQVSVSLQYSDTQIGNFYSTIRAPCPCEVDILGEKGYIRIHDPFWCPTKMTVTYGATSAKYEVDLPKLKEGTKLFFKNSEGFVYEINHVNECIRSGMLESPIITHQESLILGKISDEIRKQIGVTYAADK